MVLVDTSVWVNHFNKKDIKLSELLEEGKVVIHSFIIGELSCGKIKNRAEIIALLQNLPKSSILNLDEFLVYIENNKLMNSILPFKRKPLISNIKQNCCKTHCKTNDNVNNF